jgi:glutathione S-transferase
MLLLQFSTSHYCRKVRLALGYKQIPYRVENLTPGLHILKIRPLTGSTTTPVLMPEDPNHAKAIGDSTRIIEFLETLQPNPPLSWTSMAEQAWILEDWLDESIGTAARFVYYDYRAGVGQSLDPSWSSRLVIQTVRWQYGITSATAALARERLTRALQTIRNHWQQDEYWFGSKLSVVDLTAAALLTPLLRIPFYLETYPWLVDQIRKIHALCQEALPWGLDP